MSIATIDARVPAAQVSDMSLPMPAAHVSTSRAIWRDGMARSEPRDIPEETPVALTYGRATHAVMMATPADLGDFALGFSLSEGIVQRAEDIQALEIVAVHGGIELRMDLVEARRTALTLRQRRILGPGGCGLCGMDSVAEAIRPADPVPAGRRFTPAEIAAAQAALATAQPLNALTRAMHAAAFWTPEEGLILSREDVGRHNALDKLFGAMVWSGFSAARGVLLLSSRVSVEMVQKAAAMGAPVVVAVSVPTALAVRTAAGAGMTLIGVARDDSFEVFTHTHRIGTEQVRHGA